MPDTFGPNGGVARESSVRAELLDVRAVQDNVLKRTLCKD